MIVEFTQYFHDEWEEGIQGNLRTDLQDAGLTSAQIEDLAEKAGRPFYEVALKCAIDTETGKVEIVGLA